MKKRVKWLALIMSCILLTGCGVTDATQMSGDSQVQERTFEIPEATVETEEAVMGTSAGTEDMESSEAPSSTAVSDEVQTWESSEETQEIEITPVPPKEKAPVISIIDDTKDWYLEDGTQLLLDVDSCRVSVENSGFDALEKSLKEQFPGVVEEEYTDTVQLAREHYDFCDAEEKEYFYGYYSMERVQVARSDGAVVSFRIYYSDYTGGAHGMYTYSGKTFDTQSGEVLELTDILADAEGFYPKAAEYISHRLYEEYEDELFAEYEEYVAGTFDEDMSLNWYLNGAGIVMVYTPYEVGPYAMGSPEVTLPYSEFGAYIKPEYLQCDSEVIARIPLNYDASYLIGEAESIMLQAEFDDWDMFDLCMVSGDKTEKMGTFVWLADAYLIKRADGRCFMMIVCDHMSADYVTYVYEVTGGVLKKCSEISGAQISGEYMATDQMGITLRLDALGTYFSNLHYTLDEKGQLLLVEKILPLESAYPLTVTKELPVTMDGEATTLPVGTQIVVTGTDNVDKMYFKITDSGETGYIHYPKGEDGYWEWTIGGIPEMEYFDSIPYTG